jgi:hypothetical protein
MWWCLATGAAQADAGPERDPGAPNRALAASAERATHQPIQRAADRAHPHRAAAGKSAKAVRHHAARVLSAPNAIVKSTPVEPMVTGASDTVRSQLTRVVEETATALDKTPLGSSIPGLEGPMSLDAILPLLGESSTLQGETGAASRFSSASSAAFAGQDQAAPGSPLGSGFNSPVFGSPGNTAACAVQSGAGSGTGAGLCEAGLHITLATTRTPFSSLADWHPAGPAYPPASSPD